MTKFTLKKLKKNEAVRTLIGAVLYYSGLVPLLRAWRRRQPGRLIILTFHRATGPRLRGQLAYLHRHYRVLPLESALHELFSPSTPPASAPASAPTSASSEASNEASNEASSEASSRPARRDRRSPLVITFDDGYQDNYTQLFPLAQALGLPVTIFLIPGYLDSGEDFWWLAGDTFVRQARATGTTQVTYAERTFHLDRPTDATALAHLIDRHLRYAPSVAARDAAFATARHVLGLPALPDSSTTTQPGHTGAEPNDDESADAAARPLTWAQVREMAASGWISFGAHTQHHPILACLRDPEEVAHEVADCRLALEAHLGAPVRILAYPVGTPEAVGTLAPRLAREAGYSWALANMPGVNTIESDQFALSRIPADTGDHWLLVAARAVGVRIPGLLFTPTSKTHVPNGELASPSHDDSTPEDALVASSDEPLPASAERIPTTVLSN